MNRFAFLFFLLCAAVVAQLKSDNYSIVVHVTASRIGVESWGDNVRFVQRLSATIDGKKYELEHSQLRGVSLLRVGDYRAKLIEQNNSSSYELNQVYEFKFADGKIRQFEVVGTAE